MDDIDELRKSNDDEYDDDEFDDNDSDAVETLLASNQQNIPTHTQDAARNFIRSMNDTDESSTSDDEVNSSLLNPRVMNLLLVLTFSTLHFQ